MKSTQPLPTHDTDSHDGTHPLSAHWRRARPALILLAGGAAATFFVSGLMGRVVSSQSPPRSLPVAKTKVRPGQISLEEWRRENPSDASFLDRSRSDSARSSTGASEAGASANVVRAVTDAQLTVAPSDVATDAPATVAPSDAAHEVADSNDDGTGWKGFVPQNDDDRRRIAGRQDEDRLLAERRALEAQKKQIERALEVKALQEKYRAEDQQAQDEQREEDKKRIQARVEEDHRASDERAQSGQQLAEGPGPEHR